jgi:hypothetical protein
VIRVPKFIVHSLLVLILVAGAGVVGYLLATGEDDDPPEVVTRDVPCPEGSVASADGGCVSETRIDFNTQVRQGLIDEFYTPEQADCVIEHLTDTLSDEDILTIESINSAGGDNSQYPQNIQDAFGDAESECGSEVVDPSVPLE